MFARPNNRTRLVTAAIQVSGFHPIKRKDIGETSQGLRYRKTLNALTTMQEPRRCWLWTDERSLGSSEGVVFFSLREKEYRKLRRKHYSCWSTYLQITLLVFAGKVAAWTQPSSIAS